jgi:hypothetical protein
VKGLRVSKIGVEEGRMRRVQTRWERGVCSPKLTPFKTEKKTGRIWGEGESWFKSLAHTQEWLFGTNEEEGTN